MKLKLIETDGCILLTDDSGAVYGRYADKEEACARKEDWENYLNSPISAEGE